MSRTNKARSGVTLFETLFVIVVIAIGFGAVLSAITSGLLGIQYGNQELLAKTALRRQLELRLNQRFDTLAALAPSASFTEGLESLQAGAQGRVYVCDFNPATSTCDAQGNPNIKRVTVTVMVEPGRTWRLVTVVSRLALQDGVS